MSNIKIEFEDDNLEYRLTFNERPAPRCTGGDCEEPAFANIECISIMEPNDPDSHSGIVEGHLCADHFEEFYPQLPPVSSLRQQYKDIKNAQSK